MVTVDTKTVPETRPISLLVESELLTAVSMVEGKVYTSPQTPYSNLVQGMTADVLEAMLLERMEPLNAPELLDAKLAAAESSQVTSSRISKESEDPILRDYHTTATLLAAGKTKRGNVVYVIAHQGNPFTIPERVRQAERYMITRYDLSPQVSHLTGLPILTDNELWTISDMEDGTTSDKKDVYVFSEKDANQQFRNADTWTLDVKSPSDTFYDSSIHRNKLLTAFVGGEERKERLINELEKRRKSQGFTSLPVYDINGLNDFKSMEGMVAGIVFNKMKNIGANVGSFLGIGNSYSGCYVGGFILNTSNLQSRPRFVGIPRLTTQQAPGLEEVVGILRGGGLLEQQGAPEKVYELLGPLYRTSQLKK